MFAVHVWNPMLQAYSPHGSYPDLQLAKDRATSEVRNARKGIRAEVRDAKWSVVFTVEAQPEMIWIDGEIDQR